MKQTLIVTSVSPFFRRAGLRFTKQPTHLDASELTTEQITALKAEKNLMVREVQEEDTPPAPSMTDNKDGDSITVEQLIEAIAQLDPQNTAHYTGKGVPQLDALQAIVGSKVSAAQRDEAFVAFSEQQLQPVQQPQE
ncbi:HI1506-related protein [Thiomicrorhabdus cannonii]|uniref:HI1506-related protein n=1 Tax=Thiomicrorhabdus cannonii TaxID=2748011 RepID=UPI0015BAF4F9|nr:HI1506-related protein [Thiomicrorhabdus cannonii]